MARQGSTAPPSTVRQAAVHCVAGHVSGVLTAALQPAQLYLKMLHFIAALLHGLLPLFYSAAAGGQCA
jgi:hypothetical protein